MKTRNSALFGLTAKILFTIILFALALAPKAAAQPSGYALDFSPASNNYVSINLTAPPASNYTLAAWVKLRTGGTASGTRMAVLSGLTCNSSVEFLIHAWSETPTDPQSLELGRCGAFNGGGTSSFVPLNSWTHVAVTVRSNKLVNYYINGTPAGSWDGTGLNFSFSSTVRLGANGVRGYDGLLDNFQLWTRELSAAEIQTNVTQPLTGSESGLYAWYPFDEGSGNTATNKAVAAGGSTGALVNNPQWVAQPAFTNVPIAGLPGASYTSVAWGDYDNDGRLDFLLTGYTIINDEVVLFSQLWRNTGSGFTDVTASVAPGLPQAGYSSVAWGDYDNDGRLDFIITGTDQNAAYSQLWRNTGSGFTNVTATATPGLPGAIYSAVAWGDYDNDGRLDFLLTGYNPNGGIFSQLWRNNGSGTFSNVTATAAPGLPGVWNSSVAWGDYDNDGRLDFLLTGRDGAGNGVSQLWRNNGNGTFSNVTATAAPGLPGVKYSSVAWGDYDNDGRLDFLLTGTTDGNNGLSQLWRNTGSGFTNVPLPGVPGVWGSSVAWGDYDNDGRLDFLLTGFNGGRFSQLWRNTGSGFINVPLPGLPGVESGSVAWADYDNDGRLDFFLTGTSSENYYSQLWHNNTPFSNAPPSAPTGLALTATTNAVMLSWNSATDDRTPATGLTYNVRAGTTPGGIDLFAGHVNTANGFRRVPALGNALLRHSLPLTGLTNGQPVYWSVQAVDTAFAGGPFASETNFYSAIVTTTADSGAGSLRAAVTAATSPKLVTFDPALSGQTITLTSGQLTLSDTVTIDASSLLGGIGISGSNNLRVFDTSAGSTITLNTLTIRNGLASDFGGGLRSLGTTRLINCTFTACSAVNSGGAVYVQSGNLVSTACTFSTNASPRGAVNVANAGASFFECAFAGNTASSIGGGALNTSSAGAIVTLDGCTISGNQATGAAVGGGLRSFSTSIITITNCIVAGNTCPTVGSENLNGNILVSGPNLTNGTPLLAPLGNYGGPTQTMPPLPGSPAINAATSGTSFTTDQRGLPRIVGAYADVGAVESDFTTVSTLAANPIGPTSATLNGSIHPGDLATTTWFEWGTTTNYGSATPANLLAATTNTLAVSNVLNGLSLGSTYHYRVVASNVLGVSYGADVSFTPQTFLNVPIAGLANVYNSSVAWGDYDNDGRLDFLLTGYPGVSQLWRNTGGGFTNVPLPVVPGVSVSSVAWGDYDNDGRLDFLLTGAIDNLNRVSQLWQNNGNGTFSNVTATAFPAGAPPGVSEGSVAWGDYDNDGRLDFLLTGAGSGSFISQLWRNTGSGFTNVPLPGVPGVRSSSVAWGDYDNDGRLDFLLTGSGVCQLWRNNGNGTFSNVTATAAPGLPGVNYSSVAWGDYDNDGRLDFLLTGTADNVNGLTQLWRNTGSGFTNVPLPGVPWVQYGSVAWGDYDNDGRLDFLLTGTPNFSTGVSQLWQNTGSGFTNVPLPGVPEVLGSSVAWGDYDNDGCLDFLLTGGPGVSQLWRNSTPVTNAPPGAPTGLALTATTNAVMLSWNSAVDDHTPATGLTYNVRAGTTPGGTDLLTAHVNAANGFRRVPAMGNAMLRHSLPLTGLTNGQPVYWSVQAVDTAFAGGPFATETSVVSIPKLTLTRSSATNAIVSWSPPTWGLVLQETPSLNPITWSNSPSGELNPVSVSKTNSAKFYRLAVP